jgi:hypothetical protein
VRVVASGLYHGLQPSLLAERDRGDASTWRAQRTTIV